MTTYSETYKFQWLACQSAVDCADGFFLEVVDLPEPAKRFAIAEASLGIAEGIREMAVARGLESRGYVALATLAFKHRLEQLMASGVVGAA